MGFPGRSSTPARAIRKGRAALTPFGERLIVLYRAAERRIAGAVALQLKEPDEALSPLPTLRSSWGADAG